VIGVVVGAAGAVAVTAAVGGVGLILAKRVVNAHAQPKLLQVEFSASEVALPKSDKTMAAGEYLLHLTGDDAAVVRVGEVLRADAGTVHRQLIGGGGDRTGIATGYWSAHGFASPDEVGEFRSVEVPLASGEHRDAWLFPGASDHWVIHVQGIRTSRGVTLRTVAAAREAGATSLTITYRGSGDGPKSKAAMLGSQEWSELRDAIRYARENGAQRVTVVAWSMGAGLVFELLKREPSAVDDLVLMCPVSSWPATIEHGAVHAGLPRQAALLAGLILRSRLGAKLLGLPAPVDVRKLDWTGSGSLPVRTLVIHSEDDEVVPWSSTTKLVANNAQRVTLVKTAGCPHGFELTVPDVEARTKLRGLLIS
jgi:pimeloyl-ACP methyl ester carboxylesterase